VRTLFALPLPRAAELSQALVQERAEDR